MNELVNRLASTFAPPVLLAASLAVAVVGVRAMWTILEPDAPRFSDSRVNAHGPTVQTTKDDPDLDGDGIADRFDGIFESCGDHGCAYEVYLRRPYAADVYVGRMEGFWPFAIQQRSDEPADVIAARQIDGSLTTRYRFASGAYHPLR